MINQTSPPQISVVVLCYKSGQFASVFHKRIVNILDNYRLDYEIVLVGNYWPGKNDTTPDVVRKIANEDDRTKAVVREKTDLKKHFMSWDMRSGLEASSGNVIAVIDGDGQMAPEDIPKLYYKLINEKLDLCKAKRVSRGDGLYRKLISYMFNWVMQLFFPGINSNDINGKPKLFTRSAYNRLNLESNGWFIDAEIMIKARRHNLRVGEVETVFFENKERPSFVSLKANWEFIRNIIVWRLKEFFNNN